MRNADHVRSGAEIVEDPLHFPQRALVFFVGALDVCDRQVSPRQEPERLVVATQLYEFSVGRVLGNEHDAWSRVGTGREPMEHGTGV
jgi:hypothetical protein